mmetsp:Transcript_8813/g.20804  ORF Transcript_8813/g.20804 Transcript_8813/m.20804 type:complete len:465 (+) Transcript_8813:84-1478(+)
MRAAAGGEEEEARTQVQSIIIEDASGHARAAASHSKDSTTGSQSNESSFRDPESALSCSDSKRSSSDPHHAITIHYNGSGGSSNTNNRHNSHNSHNTFMHADKSSALAVTLAASPPAIRCEFVHSHRSTKEDEEDGQLRLAARPALRSASQSPIPEYQGPVAQGHTSPVAQGQSPVGSARGRRLLPSLSLNPSALSPRPPSDASNGRGQVARAVSAEEQGALRRSRSNGAKRAAGVRKAWKTMQRRVQASSGASKSSGQSILDVTCPVTSLDQLYSQAAGLDHMLRRKVQEWAGRSRGMFPLQDELQPSPGGSSQQQFVLWAEAAARADTDIMVRWGQLKSPDRAVEKLMRSYKQDVSRLLDICRQQIVFASIEDLLECVRVLAADEEAVVVRVKNKMHLEYNSHRSAGYRDLSINIRLEADEARALGLAGHVCEVQLQLEGFARLKNREGHKRYVQYRNFRAE